MRVACESCGVEFRRSPSRVGRHVYCSKDCCSAAKKAVGFSPQLQRATKARESMTDDERRRAYGHRRGKTHSDKSRQARSATLRRVAVLKYSVGDTKVDSNGYELILVKGQVPALGSRPRGVRGVDGARWVYRHRHVMELCLGRKLRSDECVHHKNGDKTDNSLKNLELMSSSEHTRRHSQERNVKSILRWCRLCGEAFAAHSKRHVFCSRNCAQRYRRQK